MQLLPIILSGGSGTRLWPVSRESMPKQFVPLVGAGSTFQQVLARVNDAELFARPIVITNTAYRFMVLEQLAEIGIEADVLLEPMRRDSGPAIAAGAAFAQIRDGGAVVLAAGTQAAFAINAVFYLPLFFAFLLWRRKHIPSRLPPERIDRAIISGARYATHSPAVRNIVVRALAFGAASATASALIPLVARQLLNGDPSTLGLLLGASGVGAVDYYLCVGARLLIDNCVVPGSTVCHGKP